MEKHKITQEIEAMTFNKDKVERWLQLGLHPKYGLSQELTVLMYNLYSAASGDGQYNGRYNCGACQETIYRKLKDFAQYGDNLGQPLLNWEPLEQSIADEPLDISPDEIKPVRKRKTKKKDETGTDTTE